METPTIRPGKVSDAPAAARVVAFFRSSAMANSAIQILGTYGISGGRLGVTPPEEIEGEQGMLLSVGCSDDAQIAQVEKLCRTMGAAVHRQNHLA